MTSASHRINRGRSFLAFILISLAAVTSAFSQTERDISYYLKALEQGQASMIQQAMPELITQYQNAPACVYLQARLEPDGMTAAKLYGSILASDPKSPFAADAMLHLYQYDLALGLYQTADEDFKKLSTEFPSSREIAEAHEVIVPPSGAAPSVIHTVAPAQPAPSVPVAEHPTDETDAPPVKSSAIGKGRAAYVLQVGAFSTAANAEKQKQFFEKLGYPVQVSSRGMGNKNLYLVWVGSFRSADEARQESAKLKAAHKVAAMIIER